MSSVQRAYVHRNTNVTQIIPVYEGMLTTGPGTSAYYSLNLPNVQHTGGVFYVDLSGVDISGNTLDLSGSFTVNRNTIQVISFIINVPIPASRVPGMEFTIFFKNVPFNRFLPATPLLTIGILASDGVGFPYIFSAPAPLLFGPHINQSVTLKSDGTNYNVVSSGPAGWMGFYLLYTLVKSLPN